jgi:pSer/pThr/pTyr-binding forkhead associated (FHA) protein
MGRVPNPGAPQRVSAHVVPKAPSLTTPVPDEDDEKTTIESGGWEEEASTTVEQGEVAEKVRALGIGLESAARPNTSITSTNGQSMSDEPTVDEPRANVAIALLPPPSIARLVITQGNDAGQAIEVRPGKAYTIGRALDNDLALTDVTVSRKHFDLRHDKGAWVLSDRGSGNGTLINTRLEDAPFTLANGDVIEIGNTIFRFELPNGVRRIATGDSLGDDNERSTTSGKPFHDPEPATPAQLITSVSRPKTLPPPAPVPRLRPSTNRPVPSYAPDRPSAQPLGHPPVSSSVLAAASAPTISPAQGLALHQPAPATTLPLPQMANRPPLQPSALVDPPRPPGLPGLPSVHGAPAPLGALPATIPGQGPMHPARLPFSYPSSTEIPKLAPRGTSRALAVVSAQPPRDASSTSRVQPISYPNGQPAPAQRHYTAPELSRRTKTVLAGAGLALFAAIATIAIVKGAGGEGVPTNGHGALAPAAEPPGDSPTVSPSEPPPSPTSPTPTITPIDPPPEAPPIPEPSPSRPPQPASPANPATATASSSTTTTKPEPPEPEPGPGPSAAKASRDESPAVPAIAPSNPASERASIATPARADRRPVRRPERKPDKKPAARTAANVDAARDEPERAEAPAEGRSSRALLEVKNAARVQYQAKNFSRAAEHLTKALPSFSGGDAQELKSLANIYSQLGRSYHIGMGPATKTTEAYEQLRRALGYDSDLGPAYGTAYVGDIKKRLLDVAPRAAMKYMADKAFERAFDAASFSEKIGSSSPSIKLVRDKLESLAADLLKAAQSELSSNPAEARQKARQVKGMVAPGHPLYVKASRLVDGP